MRSALILSSTTKLELLVKKVRSFDHDNQLKPQKTGHQVPQESAAL